MMLHLPCFNLERKAMANLDNVLKSRDITLLTKVHIVKAMVFPVVSHIWIWELDHKEGWTLKNGYFQIVVLEKTLESPLDYKDIKPVNPKGNQPWISIRRIDAKAPILWPARLRAREKGGDRGWDAWMASLTQWTWVWANSERWWRTGRPGVLQFMGSQRVRHNLATEQQQQNLPRRLCIIEANWQHKSIGQQRSQNQAEILKTAGKAWIQLLQKWHMNTKVQLI